MMISFDSALRLPKEHGATVAFATGCVLSLVLTSSRPEALFTIFAMVAIMMSLHRPTQALTLAAVASFLVGLSTGNFLLAVPIAAMGIGGCAMALPKIHLSFGVKQTIGMLAVGIVPLFSALILNGFVRHDLVVAVAFALSVLLSTAAVQIIVHAQTMKPTLSLAAAAIAALALIFMAPYMVLLVATPFFAQWLWLKSHPKPSLKALGIIETVTLVACATAILFLST